MTAMERKRDLHGLERVLQALIEGFAMLAQNVLAAQRYVGLQGGRRKAHTKQSSYARRATRAAERTSMLRYFPQQRLKNENVTHQCMLEKPGHSPTTFSTKEFG